MSIREDFYGSYSESHKAFEAGYDHCSNTTRDYKECVSCAKSNTPDAPPYIDDCTVAIRIARCASKFRGGVSNAICNRIRRDCEFIASDTPEANCVNLWDARLPKTEADGGDSVILESEAPDDISIFAGSLDECWRENPRVRDCRRCAEEKYFNDPCKEYKAKHLCNVHRGNKPRGVAKPSPFCSDIAQYCGSKGLPFMGCPPENAETDFPQSEARINGTTDSPVNCYLNEPNYQACRECVQLKALTGCELQVGYSRCWLYYNQDRDPKKNPYCSRVIQACSGPNTPIVIPYPSAEGYCFDSKNIISSSNDTKEVYEKFLQSIPNGYPLGRNNEEYETAYSSLPSELPPCNPPISTPTLPQSTDPTHQPWKEAQTKCCKCLLFGEARGETLPCQECALWVMYNRQKDDFKCDRDWGGGYKGLTGCAGNGPGAVPGDERSYCLQANNPGVWEGGWPNSAFKRCFCNGTNYPYAEPDDANRRRLAKLCTDLGTSNWKRQRDPTNGANYFFKCGSEADWVQCNIDGGRCFKVEGQCSGCGNCFYRCEKMPKPCKFFANADPRLETYGPDDFVEDNPGVGNPTVTNADIDFVNRFTQETDINSSFPRAPNQYGGGGVNMRSGDGTEVYDGDPFLYQYATKIEDCAETTNSSRECYECVSNSPLTNLCDDARKKTRCWIKFRRKPGQPLTDNPHCRDVTSNCDRYYGDDPAMRCYDTSAFGGVTPETNVESTSQQTSTTNQQSETQPAPPSTPPPSSSPPSSGGYGGY